MLNIYYKESTIYCIIIIFYILYIVYLFIYYSLGPLGPVGPHHFPPIEKKKKKAYFHNYMFFPYIMKNHFFCGPSGPTGPKFRKCRKKRRPAVAERPYALYYPIGANGISSANSSACCRLRSLTSAVAC